MKKTLNFILALMMYVIIVSPYSTPAYSDPVTAVTAGLIIDNVSESVDKLIQTAFDRMDLSLLQAGMEAQATVKEAETSLKGVMDHSVDRLDEQQRKLVAQLQHFERLIANDAETVLKEIREEKNSVFSDIRLMLSDYPGAIRIIPKYALEDSKYIEYKMLGTALSKAKFKNFRLNSKPKRFSIITQTDTQIVLRVPLSANEISQLMVQFGGKPAEVKISFDIIEYSWFKLFETDRRKFSAISYIMPRNIGIAQATFIGKIERIIEKRKTVSGSSGTIESTRTGIGGIGFNRKRGRAGIKVALQADPGWKFITKTAKFELKYLKGGCNKKRSSVDFLSKNHNTIWVKGKAVTHLGHRSVCEIKVNLSAMQWKAIREESEHTLPKQAISTNKDLKFRLSSHYMKILKNATLDSVKVISPLFENGTKYLQPNDELGGLKLTYNPQTRTAFLRFEYLQ